MPGGGAEMILLTILKWLGIALLCVLALLLVLCMCILFVPVRYHISVTCMDRWSAHGVVSWMFHILHLSFDTDGKKGTRLRIFGFPVSARENAGRRKRKRKKKASGVPAGSREPSQKEPEKDFGKPEVSLTEVKQMHKEPESMENETMELSGKKKRSRFIALRNRVKKFFLSIKGIFDKIKAVDREGLQLIRLLLVNGGKLLKHIFPKKVRGWIHFGTSDPAQTGEILGAVSILFAMYGQGVRVIPDFDQAVFEGKVELHGSLMGIILLILVIRVHPIRLVSYLDGK